MTRRTAYSRFLATYKGDEGSASSAREPIDLGALGPAVASYEPLLRTLKSLSFGGGLVRFLPPSGPLNLFEWNGPGGWRASWPEWRTRLVAFAYDWLGRQFCFDLERQTPEPQIALLDPGAGELLEIPATLERLLDEEFVDFADASLAIALHRKWRSTKKGCALQLTECAGYRVPLFLGGKDEVTNLECVDLNVYVTLCGQLNQGSRTMSAGETIGSIKLR